MNTIKLVISTETLNKELLKVFKAFLKTNTLVKDFKFYVINKPNKYSDGTHEDYIFHFSATDEIVNAVTKMYNYDLASIVEINNKPLFGDTLYED